MITTVESIADFDDDYRLIVVSETAQHSSGFWFWKKTWTTSESLTYIVDRTFASRCHRYPSGDSIGATEWLRLKTALNEYEIRQKIKKAVHA